LSLLDTLIEVTGYLEAAGIEFLIGGSLASSLWGQERTTHDADVAALLTIQQFELLEPMVKWPYVLDSQDMRESLASPREFASGQILNGESLDKIDLFILPTDDYTAAQLKNRRYIEVIPGRTLPFATPEDTVITKLRWFVLGNKISDRQWNDIVQVLEMQAGNLDTAYLDLWASHFGLSELLAEAVSQVIAET